ncbi:MAG: hypothetical protein WBA24_05305 [Geitlerinemataceae cyanobacterium]
MIPTQTYRDKLKPWCIIRQLPDFQRLTIATFSRRNDAEAYLAVLRRLMPTTRHVVIFANVVVPDFDSLGDLSVGV